jgi:hypothetical protein
VVGRRNVEGQHFDQVSSHARIDVLTVSGFSSAKIRALGELYDNHEIIALLSGQGVKNSTGKPFTVGMTASACRSSTTGSNAV